MLTAEQINTTLKNLGDGDLCLDENNYCTIMTGDTADAMAIHLCFDSAAGEVFLMTSLGEVPEEPRVQSIIALAMLKANFCWKLTGGRTIAYSDESEEFVLQEKYTQASENSLEDCLLRFAEAGEALTSFFRDTVAEIAKTFREEDDLDRNGFTEAADDGMEYDSSAASENEEAVAPFHSAPANDFAIAV